MWLACFGKILLDLQSEFPATDFKLYEFLAMPAEQGRHSSREKLLFERRRMHSVARDMDE